MRVLLAFDKFKDALTAQQAGEVAARVLRAKHPDWQLDLCPLTDGGEGFCDMLTRAVGGRLEHVEVSGPRGRLVNAVLGFIGAKSIPASVHHRLPVETTLAVIDLPSASGIGLLPLEQRDPWHTTTHGTGEQILSAAKAGAGAILLGVGGSATNDLGLGALAALGCRFLDAAGAVIAVPVPATWEKITHIDCSGAIKLPPILIACDVTNPLLGPHGATATFGPQKGLRAGDVPRLEAQAARMAALLCEACGKSLSLADTPGAGAAGGIGFGLMVACGTILVPGFDLVSDWLDLPARLAAADLVLTGEGRFDATSLGGKGPGSLFTEARRLDKPAHVFAGSLGVPADQAFHVITPAGLHLVEALPRTAELLAAAVARVF
ncbi:MAG: glycerate kinase [Lacunisphaera sp.]|nr:glycerate kinase [Lacunisphaera sp.]